MEARVTRRGLVNGLAGLLLLCLVLSLWFWLGLDDANEPSGPSTGSDGTPAAGTTTLPDPDSPREATSTSDVSPLPLESPREIAYGGRVLDETGRPLSGLTPRLWGRRGPPSGEDGAFSIPLDPTDFPVVWGARSLTFSSPGKQYPILVPKPIGFHGKDEIRIPVQRGPRLRLWWLDSRMPVANHAVTLRDRRGQVIRGGATGEDGTYAPFWETHHIRAYLDVEIDGGSIRYVLDRKHVMANDPLHVFVPRIENSRGLEIECRDGAGRPVAGARVQVSLAGTHGFVLDFVTDERGRGAAHFWLTDEEYDPSVEKIASWRACWRTPGGMLRTVEREIEGERPGVLRAEPFPIVLEHEPVEGYRGGLPVLVRAAGSGAPIRPETIFCDTAPALDVPGLWGTWEETPRATALDPAGRIPRRVELYSDARGSPWPDGSPFRLRVGLADRPEVEKTITMGEVRRALSGSRPITVTVPDPAYCARWIEVRSPDDDPMPYARLYVATRGALMSVLCDDRGRAFLGRVPANDTCRIVVVDGVSGAGGEIRGLRTATAPKLTTLRLEAPRVLRFRVRRSSGAVPGGVSATLVDGTKGRALAPRVVSRLMDDNLLVFPAAALSLYDLLIHSRNTKPIRIPATEVGETVVLD